MYDLVNNWEKLDKLKEKTDNLFYDKTYDSYSNTFEYVISLNSKDDEEIFKFTVTFKMNEYIHRGSCSVYVDTFDARSITEILMGNMLLQVIEEKCKEFNKWVLDNDYIPTIGRIC